MAVSFELCHSRKSVSNTIRPMVLGKPLVDHSRNEHMLNPTAHFGVPLSLRVQPSMLFIYRVHPLRRSLPLL
jgi:hypothetical protein